MKTEKSKKRKLKWSVSQYIFCIFFIMVLWQVTYLGRIFPEVLFPSVVQIISSLVKELFNGSLLEKLFFSMRLIIIGMFMSAVLTIVLTILSVFNKSIKNIISILISVFDPLPSIALLPLAILWIGVGDKAIVFVMIHSILWPMLLNIMGGFDSVPIIYKDVGLSIGLKNMKMIRGIYIPASIPNILTGFKTGWARAWRALISAEMVFGATGATGGLGWDIYTKRSYLDMPGMFASLITIMIIGILVENIVFKKIEKNTVKKWGMIS